MYEYDKENMMSNVNSMVVYDVTLIAVDGCTGDGLVRLVNHDGSCGEDRFRVLSGVIPYDKLGLSKDGAFNYETIDIDMDECTVASVQGIVTDLRIVS